MSHAKGLKAYLAEQAMYEKTNLSEPDGLVDDLIEKAAELEEPLQEKATVKGLIGTDLRHKMPPQMFAVVASLAKLIEQVEEAGHER